MAIQFLEYVLNELKEKRLPKSAAMALIRQFYYHNHHQTDSGAQLHPLSDLIFNGEVHQHIRTSLATILSLPPDEIDENENFFNLGLDSIMAVEWLKTLSITCKMNISVTHITTYTTIKELTGFLENGLKKQAGFLQHIQMKYPELFHLNEETKGRPVWWMHGGGGGVQPYIMLAQASQRPFLGIQARGWMKEDALPIPGIKAMANYYIEILRAVQPHGPYDLGGYSLAGCLAYEMTCQLQKAGEIVNSIVMIDSLSPTALKLYQPGSKDYLLEIVNFLLITTIMSIPEKYREVLIHRDEVDIALPDDLFLQQLIELAKARGLKKAQAKIERNVKKTVEVQKAYEVNKYVPEPLPDPNNITCYYFRNKNGLFYGEMEPYLLVAPHEISLDHINYWEEWECHFTDFQVIDVNASNHIIMLAEPEVHAAIMDLCAALYSENGMTVNFFRSFKNRIKTQI